MGFEIKAEKVPRHIRQVVIVEGTKHLLLQKMPPHPTPIFAAPNAPIPIVPEAIPLELNSKLEDDVMEIQRQMDAEKKRLEDAVKAKIGELRDKKWKEKANQKKQEELDRQKQEEEIWKEVDWKK